MNFTENSPNDLKKTKKLMAIVIMKKEELLLTSVYVGF